MHHKHTLYRFVCSFRFNCLHEVHMRQLSWSVANLLRPSGFHVAEFDRTHAIKRSKSAPIAFCSDASSANCNLYLQYPQSFRMHSRVVVTDILLFRD